MTADVPLGANPPTELRSRPRLLVFVVAYNAESTIENVLGRIPATLLEDYDVETLVIDD